MMTSHFRSTILAVLITMAGPVANAQTRELKTAEFNSAAVGRTMKYGIFLPRQYSSSTDRYPVLYLLHGLGQNYTTWARQNGALFYGGLYDDLIVVMIDGGNSWYVNWATSEGQKNNWDDYVVRDVIGHIDSTYRTIARREGRAIAGFSMGGYGAFALGLRHPESFISIGATSGAFDYAQQAASQLRAGHVHVDGFVSANRRTTTEPQDPVAAEARRRRSDPDIGIPGFSSQAERTPNGDAFTKAEDADSYDPFKLILKMSSGHAPHIYLDCGTDDGRNADARAMVQILLDRKIPFDYMQMPGMHNSAYWIQSIGHMMAVQYEVMQRALGHRPSSKP